MEDKSKLHPRVGERRQMNDKNWATISAFRQYKDIDIQYDDGSIRENVKCGNFERGSIKKFVDRLWEEHPTNEGYIATIIEWFNNRNCTIQLNDKRKTTLYNVVHDQLKKGKIKNPYHPSVCNKGITGEGKHLKSVNGKLTTVYNKWYDAIRRCTSEYFHSNNPTYIDCEVIDEWVYFQVFGDWFEENYKPEYMDKWELDKDILIKGNKIYSPETCVFVPKELNTLLLKSEKTRGDLPIGVRKEGKRFGAQINKNGKKKPLGTFDTPEEAFEAYKIAKEEYIKFLANKYRGQITEECYWALMNYIVEITD